MWSMFALAALAVCLPCHAPIVESYSKTGMSRSFYQLTERRRVEDFSRNNRFFHEASQSWFEMEQRDGRFYMRRRTSSYVMEKEIHYVLGSGNHTRSYVHMTSQGRLLALQSPYWPDLKIGVTSSLALSSDRHRLGSVRQRF